MSNIVFKLQDASEQPFSEVGRYPSEILHYSGSGLKIPESIIIPSSTIWKHFSDCKLAEIWSEQILKLDINLVNPKSLEILSEPIIEQILKSDLSEEIRIELSKGYSNLSSFSDSFVNIRLCTDSPVFDFSKVERKTNIKSFDNVVNGIKEVLASIFQSELLYDFYTLQVSPFTLELPILIQKSIQSEVSGIAFNLSPIDHDLEKIQIEAIVGNIEPLLNHEIIPDNYVLKKDSLEIIEQFTSKQEWMQIRSNPKQPGINPNLKIAVSKTWQNKPKLEQKQLLELAECIRSLSEKNPMASIQINWGLENGEFWLFDVKDLLKIESSMNRGFNALDLNVGNIANDHIDEIEIVKPKTIELFESSFLDDSENLQDEKKPSRKGIVIKNNEIIDPGDSNIIQPFQTTSGEDNFLRDKAKKILYGKDEKENNNFGSEATENSKQEDNILEIINDNTSVESVDGITNPLKQNSIIFEKNETSSSTQLAKDPKIVHNEKSHKVENPIHKVESSNLTKDELIEYSDPAQDLDINKKKSKETATLDIEAPVEIVKIKPFIIPFFQSRKNIISKRIKAHLKQKEAYNILYQKNSIKENKIEEHEKQSENKINLTSKPINFDNIFSNNLFSSRQDETRPVNPKTATKLFSEIFQVHNLSKDEIIESDGGVISDFQKDNHLTVRELLDITELFTPKMVIYKISIHPDIKYTNSNIESLTNDLKNVKEVKSKGFKNIHICLPYLKSSEEFEYFREFFYTNGVKQSHSLKLLVSIDNVFILHNIEKLVDSGIDGIIFNVEEILRISLGLTKEKFNEQKEIVLNEYKIIETGIKDMIDKVISICKKRKIPFILNISNFTGDNLDDLSNLAVANHAFGIQVNVKSIKRLRTVVKYYEEKHLSTSK